MVHALVLFQRRDVNNTRIIMTKKVNGRREKRGMDKLMIALTKRQDAAAAMLSSSHKKQERPTPINLSVTSGQGGLQMSIEVGIEKGKTMDI